jgi:hypothetical protein
MSKRESRDQETRLSPYLLRPARTYEEYLRDRAIADRVQKQFDVDPTVSITAKTKNLSTKNARICKDSHVGLENQNRLGPLDLTLAGQSYRHNSTNNQTEPR